MALLKAGANAKAKDSKEKTAFDYAKHRRSSTASGSVTVREKELASEGVV